PEQASGRAVDHRTDIFSLGLVLHEMITGERPFQRNSAVETLHAIINDPAPLVTNHPPEVEEILAKALAKDPKDRYQHAGDLALDLRRFGRALESKTLPSLRRGAAAAPKLRIVLVAVAAIVIAVTAWWASRLANAQFENPLAEAQFTPLTDFPGSEWDAAISPDGNFVAFLADRDGPFDIFVNRVGTRQFLNLTQGHEPNLGWRLRVTGFSGDGSEVWLHDSDPASGIRTMPLMGGEPRTFLGNRAQNVAWSRDGLRVVYHTSD